MLRVVSAACKLAVKPRSAAGAAVASAAQSSEVAALAPPRDVTRERRFMSELVSAVSEAFNNIAIHGYRGREPDVVQVEIAIEPEWMTVELRDFGNSFDITQARPPDLDSMPESGLGIFIIRSFVDKVSYVPSYVSGQPNVLTLSKRIADQ